MDDPDDLENVDGEIEIIELDEPVEEGIIDFDENSDCIVQSASDLEAGGDEDNVELIDFSKQTFSLHTKSVFQGVLNAAGSIAATGAEDDVAYVWLTETCEVLLECTGHKDSVTHLAFNFDEQLLATADMGGLIQVWDLKERRLAWCYEGDDLEWLLWHPKVNVLFAGYQFGNIFVWQIPQGNCKVLASRGETTTCGHILSDGVRLLAGYANGQVRLWDVKTETVIWELQPNILTNGITSLDVTKDDSLFIVAPSAQLFKVIDGSLVSTLFGTSEIDIEAVAFSNESGFLATGALSGKTCVWDIRTNTLRHEAKLDASITTIKWGPNDQLILGSSDANIYIVDAKSGILTHTLTGHSLDILSLSLSKDGSVLLSTSDDTTAKVFILKSSSQP